MRVASADETSRPDPSPEPGMQADPAGPIILTVAHATLEFGGLPGLDDTLDILAEQQPDVLGLAEITAAWYDHHEAILARVKKTLGLAGYPRRGVHPLLDTAVLYNPSRLRQVCADPVVFELCDVRANEEFPYQIAVKAVQYDYAVPSRREQQALADLATLADFDAAIMIGDFNDAFRGDEPPDVSQLPLAHRARHLNPDGTWHTAATDVFLDHGYVDAGASDRQPTGGLRPAHTPKRPDGILVTAALAAMHNYRRLPITSDHKGVAVDIDLSAAAPILADMCLLRTGLVTDAEAGAARLTAAGLPEHATQLLNVYRYRSHR